MTPKNQKRMAAALRRLLGRASSKDRNASEAEMDDSKGESALGGDDAYPVLEIQNDELKGRRQLERLIPRQSNRPRLTCDSIRVKSDRIVRIKRNSCSVSSKHLPISH